MYLPFKNFERLIEKLIKLILENISKVEVKLSQILKSTN